MLSSWSYRCGKKRRFVMLEFVLFALFKMLEDEESTNQEESQPEIDLLEEFNNNNIDDDNKSENDSKDERISKASSKVLLKTNPVFDLNRPSTKVCFDKRLG